MATMTNEEIEQLKQQLEEKKKEIDVIYDKLVEAGVVPLPDDFLDEVSGGNRTYGPVAPSPTPSGRTAKRTKTGYVTVTNGHHIFIKY